MNLHQTPTSYKWQHHVSHTRVLPIETRWEILPINIHLLKENIRSLTQKHCGEGKLGCGSADEHCHKKLKKRINQAVPDERINTFSSSGNITNLVRFAINWCMGDNYLTR